MNSELAVNERKFFFDYDDDDGNYCSKIIIQVMYTTTI